MLIIWASTLLGPPFLPTCAKAITPNKRRRPLCGCRSFRRGERRTIAFAERRTPLGLLHDWGKACPSFRDYLLSATGLLDQDADNYVDATRLKGRIDHSTAAAQWLWEKGCTLGVSGPSPRRHWRCA